MTSAGGVIAVAAAGLAAGTINTVVGSGTLITFPVLLSLGVPPVTANVSNTIGLVPGGFSGVYGYRRELTGQRDRLLRLGLASLIGGLIGSQLANLAGDLPEYQATVLHKFEAVRDVSFSLLRSRVPKRRKRKS